jgi:hypothetical protein
MLVVLTKEERLQLLVEYAKNSEANQAGSSLLPYTRVSHMRIRFHVLVVDVPHAIHQLLLPGGLARLALQ